MYWGADDRKDLIAGRSDGRVVLFTNVGTDENPTFDAGVFLQAGPAGSKTDIDVGARACATVVDWDSDGRRDLVIGGYDGLIHIFLNTGTDGAPDFEAQTYAQNSGVDLDVVSNRASPHVEDLDNDGRKDILIGNTNGEVVFHSNTGTDQSPDFSGYTFIEAAGTKIDLPGTPRSRPFVCDWNADGRKDLLVGAGDGLVRVYLGVDHEAGVTDEPLAAVRLLPPRPNPFDTDSRIAFELREPSRVALSVYDVSGRRVAGLADRRFASGRHEVPWSGTSGDGTELASGVYFVVLRTPDEVHRQMIVLVR